MRKTKNKKGKRKTLKGGKTLKENFNNCQNYWHTYSDAHLCGEEWRGADSIVRPIDVINYPGFINKRKGEVPTWLPIQPKPGELKRDYRNEKNYIQRMIQSGFLKKKIW